jgi:hypothetical protein
LRFESKSLLQYTIGPIPGATRNLQPATLQILFFGIHRQTPSRLKPIAFAFFVQQIRYRLHPNEAYHC